jgi:hypothetical protein
MRRTKPKPKDTGAIDPTDTPASEAAKFDVARFIRSEREKRIQTIIRTVLKPLVKK